MFPISSVGYVLDNTKSFADMGFVSGGAVITFGSFPVYVAIAAKKYSEEVLTCLVLSAFDASTCNHEATSDYLDSGNMGCGDSNFNVYAEVNMVEHTAAGGGVAKTVHEAGEPSQLQRDLEADFELLSTPIAPGADPTKTAAELEKMRQQMYDKALHLASTQRRLG